MNIELYDLSQAVLLVPAKTGVFYSVQAGGTGCFRFEAEGFLVPLEYDVPLESPEKTLIQNLYRIFPEGNPGVVEEPEAEKIQTLLSASPNTQNIKINERLLRESTESWVHVLVNGPIGSGVSNIGTCEAILTWSNSD